MVRLYKELFGRGPTKTRTNYAGPDTLVATIENSLTSVERKMLELDEHQRVGEIRMFFQHASESDFMGMVEEITGRTAWAFVSGIDTQTDWSAKSSTSSRRKEIAGDNPLEPLPSHQVALLNRNGMGAAYAREWSQRTFRERHPSKKPTMELHYE